MDAAAVGLWGLFTSAFLSATLMFIALGKIARYTVVLFVVREALA